MLIERASFRRLCRARELLRERSEDARPIDDIARAVAISPYHFIRQFDALFGLTPHQFRIQCRMDEAKRLLATGHQSVTEVCMAVGFSSLGSFSDSFKRRVGTSPSAYQRRLRAACSVPARLASELATGSHLPSELMPGCLSLLTCLPQGAFRNFREASGGRMLTDSSSER